MSYIKAAVASAATSALSTYYFQRPTLNAEAVRVLGPSVARATAIALTSLALAKHFESLLAYLGTAVVLTAASLKVLPQIGMKETAITVAIAVFASLLVQPSDD